MIKTKRQKQASVLRAVRAIHRWTGASLFLLFLVVSLSGLALGWKKNSGGYLLPETAEGSSLSAEEWLPTSILQQKAQQVLREQVSSEINNEVDRLDLRPSKGIVKVTFKKHYYEIQLDCATGEALSVAFRRSDFLEQLHDGSIIDRWLDTKFFKLFYTSLTGFALFTFTITGFWLWFGPKVMRRRY